jgi:hypothetical protein
MALAMGLRYSMDRDGATPPALRCFARIAGATARTDTPSRAPGAEI